MTIETAGKDVDYTDTLKRFFGQRGWNIGMACYIVNLYVPILIFFQLMAQFLCPVILLIISGGSKDMDLEPSWNTFNYTWTCVLIFAIVFAMTAIKDMNIFVRINSFGVIFIFMIIFIIAGNGVYGIIGTDFTTNIDKYNAYVDEKIIDPKIPYLAYIQLFGSSVAVLMGLLGGGFYFHNISLPVIRGSEKPDNNNRDVFIGYFLVYITYCLVGILGYYGFSGDTFASKNPS